MRAVRLPVRDLCYIGIFAAIISALAQVSIPMPYGVPLTLQTFAIALAGVILGAKRGAMTAVVYVLLSAVGAPVLAGFVGGMGFILGSTGGFILSFPIIALAAGIGAGKGSKAWLAAGLAAGVIINYLCGILMFSAVTSSGLKVAFTACVLPFIPTDIIKMVFAALMGGKARKILTKGKILV